MKIALLIAFICIIGAAYADDAANTTAGNSTTVENVTVVDKPLVASPDIRASFVFPSSAQKKFIIGTGIPVLLGLTNAGEHNFNVSLIGASLKYPQDWRYFIQNYTRTYYGQIIPPGEHATFLYTFYPDPMLEPREFGLQANVYYSDAHGENYTSTFYNGTIFLVESNESIDAQTLFTYVGILGVAGLVGFVVYKSGRTISKKKSRRVEYGTQQSDVLDNEWLEGTAAAKSPKAFRSPKIKPKKS